MVNIGTVQSVTGIVRAIKEDGTERVLSIGDSVAENETVITGDGVIVITFSDGAVMDLGSYSSAVLNDDMLGQENEQAAQNLAVATAEVDALQKALTDPEIDPTEALPPTAAGVTDAGGASNNGHTIVSVDYLNPRAPVESGFDTEGITQVFEQPDEELPPVQNDTTNITENDTALSFAIASTASISEDAAETATFSVSMTGSLAPGETASVDIGLGPQSATDGADYTAFLAAVSAAAALEPGVSYSAGTLTFDSSFDGQFDFTVDAINDSVVEGTETIVGQLSNASVSNGTASITTASTTTDITENDTALSFDITVDSENSMNDASNLLAVISEEDTSDNEGIFIISKSGNALATGNTASVTITVSGSAKDADFQGRSGAGYSSVVAAIKTAAEAANLSVSGETATSLVVTWDSTSDNSFNVDLVAFDDAIKDSSEVLTLTLAAPSISHGPAPTLINTAATLRVEDIDNDIPVIKLAKSTDNSSEFTIVNHDDVSSAGYHNSYGYYVKTLDSNGVVISDDPTIGVIVEGDVHFHHGGFTNPLTILGFSQEQIGYFIIPNGNAMNKLVDGQQVTFKFVSGEWQAFDGHDTPIKGAGSHVLFDIAKLNKDGQDHVQDNALKGNQNWEDLQIPTSDGDYNDVNLNVDWTKVTVTGDVVESVSFGSDGPGIVDFDFDNTTSDVVVSGGALKSNGYDITFEAKDSDSDGFNDQIIGVANGAEVLTIDGILEGKYDVNVLGPIDDNSEDVNIDINTHVTAEDVDGDVSAIDLNINIHVDLNQLIIQ
ncbi:MAG: hypothetical protein CL866_04390 [Cycloclasticus sp.]|nr:hypothetical protein [Cycloclasticus sp.]MBG96095.1 hypothetical protein [Cycloclasticus sp.]